MLVSENVYAGFSYYWDNTNSKSLADSTWLCDAVPEKTDSNVIQGYCYNFMPTLSGSGVNYRYTPNDVVGVWGWTNVSS